MIRQRVERKMELAPAETHFPEDVSNAFFSLGYKPPAVRERIHGVTVRHEDDGEWYRILVDLSRTHKTFGTEISRQLRPTTRHRERPVELLEAMRDPIAMVRANRVLVASEGVYDKMSGLVIGGIMATGYIATHF